jgi:hypothetical protein
MSATTSPHEIDLVVPTPERPPGAWRALGAAILGFMAMLPVPVFAFYAVDVIEVAWTTAVVVPMTAFLGWKLGTEAHRNGWTHFAYGVAAHGWLIVGTMAWMCTLYLDFLWQS